MRSGGREGVRVCGVWMGWWAALHECQPGTPCRPAICAAAAVEASRKANSSCSSPRLASCCLLRRPPVQPAWLVRVAPSASAWLAGCTKCCGMCSCLQSMHGQQHSEASCCSMCVPPHAGPRHAGQSTGAPQQQACSIPGLHVQPRHRTADLSPGARGISSVTSAGSSMVRYSCEVRGGCRVSTGWAGAAEGT